MPLNNKETMTRQRQRSVSSDRGSQDEGDEGLEEPLRAKKRRESQTVPVEGRWHHTIQAQLFASAKKNQGYDFWATFFSSVTLVVTIQAGGMKEKKKRNFLINTGL